MGISNTDTQNKADSSGASFASRLGRLSKGTRWLGSLLLLQLVLAGGLLLQSQRSDNITTTGSLIAFEPEAIDRVLIEAATNAANDNVDESESPGASIELEREAEQWTLVGQGGLPADTTQVEGLVSSLADLQAGLPVATRAASHAQLDVAEDDFQRRVVLSSGDEVLVELYVGSSPGFRKAHVRKAGNDATYAAALNTFELPTNIDDWLDKNLLSITDLDSIKGAGFELQKSEDEWSLAGAPDELSTLDHEEVERLVDTLESLSVSGLAETVQEPVTESSDTTPDEATGQEQPQSLVYTLSSQAKAVELTLTRQGDDQVIAQRSDIPGRFRINVADFDTLKAVTIQSLTRPAANVVPGNYDSAAESGSLGASDSETLPTEAQDDAASGSEGVQE